MIVLPERVVELNNAIRTGQPVQTDYLQMTSAHVAGRPVNFCTTKRRDPIQNANRDGTYYELKDLLMLAHVIPENSTIFDIGANVGNHSLFFALICKAKRVIPVEPNPLAFELLFANVMANNLSEVIDLGYLGVGAADRQIGGFAMEERRRNLGAARMLPQEGDLNVYRVDDLLSHEIPDMVKIDVEGMEISVLEGMSDILARKKPMMFVEVDNDNAADFDNWCATNDYKIAHTIQRYRENKNHLIVETKQVDAISLAVETFNSGKIKC